MNAVSNNSNLLQWVWLCHVTLYHEHNDKNGSKMTQKGCDTGFKLLLSGTCQKKVITSTTRQMF